MNSKPRSPKIYTDTNKYTKLESNTESHDVYDDTKLNNLIVDNRDEIMILCNNKEYDKLKDLLNNLMNNEVIPWYISDTLSGHCIIKICEYSIKNNNLEL